jgi:hypothetical protein
MGLLEAGPAENTRQLEAKTSSSLSEEDMKELEDLDLSGIDVDEISGGTTANSAKKTEDQPNAATNPNVSAKKADAAAE